MACQGRGAVRHRLRLPHDHGRRRRGGAEGDGLAGRRGDHQLQAVHGLPGPLLQRRRPDPEGHAEGRQQRRPDHHARRERHRHRRAVRAGRGQGPDRSGVPRHHQAVPPGGRGHQPGHPVGACGRRAGLLRAPVVQRGTGEGRRGPQCRSQRVRRDLPAVPVPEPRGPPRSTGLRRSGVRLLATAANQGAHAPQGPLEGPANQRPGDRRHGPLPVLHEGPEGAGQGRLPCHPERHRRRRAPHGPHLPGRRHGRADPGALGGDLLHHAGPDVRHVPAEGRDRPGF